MPQPTLMAVYAASLYCDTGDHDAVWHAQVIEIDRDKNRYRIDVQYGKSTQARLTTKAGTPKNFRLAVEDFQETVAKKQTSKNGDRVYVPATTVTLPNGVTLLPPDVVCDIENGKKPVAAPKPIVDLEDPKIKEALEDGYFVGVAIPAREVVLLERKEGQVILNGRQLPIEHPIAIDAHTIGGEFGFAGYQDGKDKFVVVDMSDAEMKGRPFQERLEEIALIFADAEPKALSIARFLVGERKREALDAVVRGEFTHVRFTKVDETMLSRGIINVPGTW